MDDIEVPLDSRGAMIYYEPRHSVKIQSKEQFDSLDREDPATVLSHVIWMKKSVLEAGIKLPMRIIRIQSSKLAGGHFVPFTKDVEKEYMGRWVERMVRLEEGPKEKETASSSSSSSSSSSASKKAKSSRSNITAQLLKKYTGGGHDVFELIDNCMTIYVAEVDAVNALLHYSLALSEATNQPTIMLLDCAWRVAVGTERGQNTYKIEPIIPPLPLPSLPPLASAEDGNSSSGSSSSASHANGAESSHARLSATSSTSA
jgi:hypothetical protein